MKHTLRRIGIIMKHAVRRIVARVARILQQLAPRYGWRRSIFQLLMSILLMFGYGAAGHWSEYSATSNIIIVLTSIIFHLYAGSVRDGKL